MFRPETTSGLSDEALANCGYKMAGRKLANRPSALRRPRYGLLRPEFACKTVVFPVAHRAEQDGVRILGQLQRGRRQRMPVRIEGGAADRRRIESEVQSQRGQYTYGLFDYFSADSIARQYRNLVSHYYS